MTEITSRLSTALADRYRIERHLGEGPATNHARAISIRRGFRFQRRDMVEINRSADPRDEILWRANPTT